MSINSTIEWTETTWNPTTGCDRISPGCDNCYALALAKRLKAMGSAKYKVDGDPRTSGPGFGVMVHLSVIEEPLKWRTPRKVFVNSMSDIGHARVGTEDVARIWAVMALTSRHQYQVLTKRPKRLAKMLLNPAFAALVAQEATNIIERTPPHLGRWRLDLGGDRVAGDSGVGDKWAAKETADGMLLVATVAAAERVGRDFYRVRRILLAGGCSQDDSGCGAVPFVRAAAGSVAEP